MPAPEMPLRSLVRLGSSLTAVPFGLLIAARAPSVDRSPAGHRPAASQGPVSRHTLMPVPASVTWGEGEYRLDSSTTIGLTKFIDTRLRSAVERSAARLEALSGLVFVPPADHPPFTPRIAITVDAAGQRVQTVSEDESYSLAVNFTGATLYAHTVVGALRGLETLLQLVESDRDGFYLPAVRIEDMPRFRWRGLLMDVSRHFMPVDEVKHTLDGMAAVKLNVFHWHLTDDQGFRVESKRYPRLQGSGSDGLYYTQAEIREIVAYARDRGIRVIPEFDMPGHTTSWLVGYPQYASVPGKYEIERHFGASDAIFDPSREPLYTFIDRFIGEIAPLFPDHYWHVGGDEVDPKQWNTPRIRAFRKAHKLKNAAELQVYFNRRLTRILARYGKRLVGWDEVLQPNLPKTSVVQSWRGVDYLAKSTADGYASILSAPWYLDHIDPAEQLYIADPIPPTTELTPEQQALILGGEACMWAEHVASETVDSRIWPRLAAIAERLWSPRDVIQVNDMYRRLWVMSDRLERLGLMHESHTNRMLRRITEDDSTREALATMLEAVGPPSFGQRVRGQRTDQLTPLVRVLDAAVPDPWGRWETSMLVDRLLSDTLTPPARIDTTITLDAARARLTELFTRWRDAANPVRIGADSTPLVAEAVPAAAALSRTAQAGLEALGYLGGNERPAPGWSDALLAELKGYEQPQNLLRVMIVQPVERLVAAAEGVHGSQATGMGQRPQVGR